jgi:FkbM family methyltransferase
MSETAQIQIGFAGEQYPFTYANTPAGLTVLADVFSGKSYPIVPLGVPIETIVDVGANIGTATVWLAMAHPQAKVYAFEPGPEAAGLLAANTAFMPLVSTFAYGLYDRDVRLPLFEGVQDSVSASVGQSANTGSMAQEVELRDAGAALAALGVTRIDLLKVDTEGCELPILRSLGGLVAGAALVYVEYHSEPDRRAIDALLAPSHTLARAAIGQAHMGELCYVRSDLRLAGEEPLDIKLPS